ncbi:ferritin-like domain-containing protein [Actinacidiphila paucisporea]|uniref:Ferritin-like domain-containing protein n=1 Tax=Actinacidiphila paucisporea TaxID=310782 RepID=A0A1M7QT07_9ACTN|nr:ferritin-like domain-containing protein [Actinacidiphila paucisporea]SHN34948.1 Ferritin-like domain-containing protein [Actinacidiphila paucisporea]
MTTARDGWDMPISEDQLARLTRDMETAHRDTLPAMRAGAVDLAADIRDTRGGPQGAPRDPGRRRFLTGTGGLAAAMALAACSSSDKQGSGSPSKGAGAAPSPSGSAKSRYTGDLKVVALAVALENQAVGAYQAALAAAKAGKLGTVPPAVATFVTTAMAQHSDHAKAWNSVLTGAGVPAIHDVPLSNQPATLAALGKATTVTDVAKLALQLEDQAAQTYLFATYNVSAAAGVATAASIAPVEAMHAAILHFVLGQYPVPDDFLPVDKAADPALLTV